VVIVTSALALVLTLGATGCGGGGGDDDAGAPPPAADSTMSTTAPDETAAPGDPGDPSDPGITSPPTSLPAGSVVVPLDADLVDALPRLSVGQRQISDDLSFDERLCTGDKAPALPEGQARATYEVSATERITIAAYRFSPGDGPLYLADYAAAVQDCAVEIGPVEGLGLSEAIGQAFGLTTSRGDAFIAMALRKDVVWILFQERTDGPVGVTQGTYDTYLRLLGA
jgi:hypothetical protein